MQPSLRRASLALVIGLTLGACSAASTPLPSGAQSASATASQPAVSQLASAPASAASPSAPESAAPSGSTGAGGGDTGSETVRLVLTGGQDEGTYTTTADPLCSLGLIGEGGWGVQYSTADLTGDKDFTSFQLVYYPDGAPDGEAMFADTPLLAMATIGSLLEGGRTYEVVDNTADASQSKGEGTASVEEGDQPVITFSGTTDDGVELEVTVNCPSVTRM